VQTATDKIDHPVVSRGNSCKRLAIVTEMGSFRRHARFMTINPGDSPQKFLSIIHPCAINPNDRDGCTAAGPRSKLFWLPLENFCGPVGRTRIPFSVGTTCLNSSGLCKTPVYKQLAARKRGCRQCSARSLSCRNPNFSSYLP